MVPRCFDVNVRQSPPNLGGDFPDFYVLTKNQLGQTGKGLSFSSKKLVKKLKLTALLHRIEHKKHKNQALEKLGPFVILPFFAE